MKKLLFAATLVGVGIVIWRLVAQEDEARDLWAEVTDKV
ncbi:DLW-39 family protein [Rarobacter incanus]|uniref:Uncharacterized protein n=1 Tax=Rarobacter incanus TaxID=153494 RepID=A0A542SQ18_9MICO|nr:DLW-39 family protein [Rarobacter incanus]TQK76675.1 hypothetical protein FB389_1364 [Rarobacter incanus]